MADVDDTSLDRNSVDRTSLERGHEVADVPPLKLFVAGLLALASVGLILLLVWGMTSLFVGMTDRPPVASIAHTPIEPPPPRLQGSPARDLQAFRAAEGKELHTLGWVDRGAGLARIPIEDAMALLAKRGWPEEGK
ncbi:hypothetical protein D9623_15720 [Azospirillum brasilense]|uniref:Uncharacterized protein n=1 Tax=Azospirillum brasilense TaxID=192 RepID=A0A0P0EM07_AZOBR|nr:MULTISPECIES: hypothetical protein [Azospirillum]ALJ37054.1 hypothetical protein AMK58_16245 [Azospirillum brasilense]MDW7551747.1 hypothetical protein [Azospirillum brasilense]MDW7591182.1 hypothetical protein [Azospirillum brasilense]MDW7626352.1 hypothetical protein [Azospirillum brasilense]MDX5951299.1 hypothetical protein [Azospirillum brasilense]